MNRNAHQIPRRPQSSSLVVRSKKNTGVEEIAFPPPTSRRWNERLSAPAYDETEFISHRFHRHNAGGERRKTCHVLARQSGFHRRGVGGERQHNPGAICGTDHLPEAWCGQETGDLKHGYAQMHADGSAPSSVSAFICAYLCFSSKISDLKFQIGDSKTIPINSRHREFSLLRKP
jgi:hypothetical protein